MCSVDSRRSHGNQEENKTKKAENISFPFGYVLALSVSVSVSVSLDSKEENFFGGGNLIVTLFFVFVSFHPGMATRLLSNPHQNHRHHHHHSRFSHPSNLPPLQPHHGFLGLRSKFKGIRVNVHSQQQQQQQQQHINTVFYHLGTPSTRRNNTIVVRAVHTGFSSSLPLVSPSNHWGTWSILLSIAAFGIWYVQLFLVVYSIPSYCCIIYIHTHTHIYSRTHILFELFSCYRDVITHISVC